MAVLFGLSPLGAMDQATFFTNRNSTINIMSATFLVGEGLTEEQCRYYTDWSLKHYIKLNYKLVSYFGDYYYQQMPHEESKQKAFHFGNEGIEGKVINNKNDLDCFI